MPHIAVLTTGGTIASRGSHVDGASASDSGEQLLNSLPELPRSLTVEVHDLLRINSYNLDFYQMRIIAEQVHFHLSRSDVDGVVLTHGTDTLEETAALLAATHAKNKSLVLTGAQRSADVREPDGPKNLYDAIRVAADSQSAHQGVLVSAFGVTKASTLAPQPFENKLRPCVEADLQYEAEPASQAASSLTDILPLIEITQLSEVFDTTRVELVTNYPGADEILLLAAAEAGAKGIIVLGSGSGNPGKRLMKGIEQLHDRGIVVAIASRTGHGNIAPLYGNGGAVSALQRGAVTIGCMPVFQARVLLALLLSCEGFGSEPNTIAKTLARWCGGLSDA